MYARDIQFSNDLSYQESPLIPLRQYPPDRLEPLVVRTVSDGFREGKGQFVTNPREAEAVVEAVRQCCCDPRYSPGGKKLSMGVIVLQGKTQARRIEALMLSKLDPQEIEERKIICGDPYSFQGDERDVIFLGLVAAPNERNGPLTKETDRRRFNVAASRARNQMWLFSSVSQNDLSPSCFRRRLLEYFEDPMARVRAVLPLPLADLRRLAHQAKRVIEKAPQPFDSWFEVDVALEIANRGYRVVPQFPVADKRIDLMIDGSGSRLAIECDGDAWHGPDQYEKDTERQRKLERMGWKFWRIRESEYYANRQSALVSLWQELKLLEIQPVGP